MALIDDDDESIIERAYPEMAPTRSRLGPYMREIEAEPTDLGKVVIGATMVENAIELHLRTILRRMPGTPNRLDPESAKFMGSNGVIDSTSKRIRFLYVTGAIESDLFLELSRINDIRNRFAHDVFLPDNKRQSKRVSFKSPQIRDRIKQLTLLDMPGLPAKHRNSTGARRWEVATSMACLKLYEIGISIAEERLAHLNAELAIARGRLEEIENMSESNPQAPSDCAQRPNKRQSVPPKKADPKQRADQ